MPLNMGLAALLMSGAIQSGEPATKLTLSTDAVSQPDGSAPIVLAGNNPGSKPKKGGKKAASGHNASH